MKARTWFRFENSASDPAVAEIHIVDFIGSWDDDWFARNFGYDMGVTARAFVEELAKLPASINAIHLHLNSPGGDVQGGINIANALREQTSKGRSVETFIDGIAASIASVIAMAGSKVHISDNGLVMTHNPMSIAIGNAGEMRKTADILDTMRGQIINTYKWHSSLSDDELIALMNAETWMNADEAVANGFATNKIEGLKAVASIDPRAAAQLKVPEKYRARVDALLKKETPAPVAASSDEVFAAVEAAGFDIAFGRQLVSARLPMLEVAARIATAKDERTARDTRATNIRALCATAKLPELADDYIAGGMSEEKVRAQLVTMTAKLAGGEIDNKIPERDPGVTVADSWKKTFTAVKSRFGTKRQ